MFDPDDFARRLALALKLRKVRKMYALAVEMGIDESVLSRIRRGRSLTVGNLLLLSRHLHVSTDWLLTGAGAMDAPDMPDEAPWRSDIVADLSDLDAGLRDRILGLVRHLARDACA